MAIKKITLTEDHIRLISALNFNTFSFGDRFNTSKIDDAIEEINYRYMQSKDEDKNNEYSTILEYLIKSRDKIARINENRNHYAWGIDQWSLWGGNYVFEDIARLIGKYDEVFPETIEDTQGPRFPEETEKYMLELYHDIADNIELILQLVFQFIDKGGLTPGTYKCINYQGVWEKVE